MRLCVPRERLSAPRRWQQSSIRLIIPASSLAGPLLDFTDVSHGWLVLGNATWHTADGGRTWTRA